MSETISGAIAALSTVSGDLIEIAGTLWDLAGSISAVSSVSGTTNAPSGVPCYLVITGSSGFVASSSVILAIAGSVEASSTVSCNNIEWRSAAYVPAVTLYEPYPVPLLWKYTLPGVAFNDAVSQWSNDMARWSEEHMIRVMRELSRMSKEVATDWVVS